MRLTHPWYMRCLSAVMKQISLPAFLLRLCFVAVALAGLAAIALNLTLVKQKITGLQASLAAQTSARQEAAKELANARTRLTAATTALDSAVAALATAKEERQAALASLTEQKQLTAKVTAERNDARAETGRYRAAGMEPEQIIAAAGQIKQLTAALAAAEKTNAILVARLRPVPVAQESPIQLPANLTAKVLASDPKWHFILLDAGGSNGVLNHAEILVRREGKLIARARVTRVQEDRCIADLLPGWELAEVLEGDIVIPAFPHS